MTGFIFYVTVMVNGVFSPDVIRVNAVSPICIQEQQTIAAINRNNIRNGIDVLYFGDCRAE